MQRIVYSLAGCDAIIQGCQLPSPLYPRWVSCLKGSELMVCLSILPMPPSQIQGVPSNCPNP